MYLIFTMFFFTWLNIVTDDLGFWQERKDPNVNFGFDDGPKKVGISEASSNLTVWFIMYYYASVDMHLVDEVQL